MMQPKPNWLPTWLYVISETGTRCYKIGITDQIAKKRIQSCQTGNPRKLVFCCALLYMNREMARGLEKKILLEAASRDWRMVGEWVRMPAGKTIREFVAEQAADYPFGVDCISDTLNFDDFVSVIRAGEIERIKEQIKELEMEAA